MTSNTFHHSSIRQLAALALIAFWFSATAFAQSMTSQTPSPKVNLIIERNAIRFDLQGEARSWQIEVFNQSGDLIFGSGVVRQTAIQWPLEDPQSKSLAAGLYAYTLKFWNDDNEMIGARRGHVIVDRASAHDRIWVTTDNATGVGAEEGEVTVAGAPESTLGGARLPARAPVAERENQPAAERPQRAGSASAKGAAGSAQNLIGDLAPLPGPINGLGTPGRIAKFTGQFQIGDSVINEVAGNLLVNTNLSLGKLSLYNSNANGLHSRSESATGVWGQSASGRGVYGLSTSNSGVEGSSIESPGAVGISSRNHGVYGTTGSDSFAGVFGVNNTVNGKGVFGRALNGADAAGVFGESSSGKGVYGDSQTGTGVRGESDSGTGVYGFTNTGRAVWGVSNSNNGVFGQSSGNHGAYGRSTSADHAGVYGYNTSVDGVGVLGVGVGGANQSSIGVYGSASGYGVVGVGEAGHGVAGYGSFLGASIYGAAGAAWAGRFDGNVDVTGNLSKGGGSFKIDHPLDPANKYLYHSFVESPDMMNIYNGNITTDGNGEATVTLPAYFDALNRDFRYQLTAIGQFAQAIVADKIAGGRFVIRTDKPNVEVSWQVTGVRHDAFAEANRIPVEAPKPENERGYYLHPTVFGQAEEKGVEWARHPELMKQMKATREKRRLESTQKPQQ